MKTKGLFVAFALLSFFARMEGQVPLVLNHQGRVVVNGVPFDGSGQFNFALVNSDGSQTYWQSAADTTPADGQPDSPVSLSVSKGLYSVGLGDTAVMLALNSSMLAHPDVRLRVWFSDRTHGFELLTPDQRLGSVAYAVMAKSAETAASATTVTSVETPPGMAFIPGGAFTMGDSVDGNAVADASPISVTVSAFYMDVHEVTWSQWRSVYFWATNHGYEFLVAVAGKGAHHPVQSLNWYDCVKWCNARSEQGGKTPVYYTDAGLTAVYRTGEVAAFVNWGGKGYRLPTEAEWEKAARGGLSEQRFPWGNTINQNLANYSGDTRLSYDLGPIGLNEIGIIGGRTPATSPVGSFAANLYGLYDMAGNVWEWCWDWYALSPFPVGSPYLGGTDPHGPALGGLRVQRGGSWSFSPSYCRSADRGVANPVYRRTYFGFRSVLSPGQP